jgi:hypothetical protein
MVVLATPSGLHPGQVIAAAEAGLHVCTEKPMATRWADGVAMVKACDDAGVRLFVVKQNRFNSTLQLVRRQLQAGRFGKLAMVAVQDWLKAEGLQTKMVMQVHDELVLDVPQQELEQIRMKLPSLMCDVAALKVPLVAEVGVGPNWEQAH